MGELYMKKAEATKYSGKGLLKGKKCVVTGGALGIGSQISYLFAENEAEVIIKACVGTKCERAPQ